MGLQDRDDYREHDRRAAANPTRTTRAGAERASYRRVLLICLVITASVFAAMRYAAPPETVARRAAGPSTSPSKASSSLPRSAGPTPSSRADPASRPDDASRSAAGSPSSPPIYRCANSYGATPCANGRRVDAPAASGFDSRPSEALALLVAEGRATDEGGPSTVVTTRTTAGNGTADACRSWAATIDGLDRRARQPQSAGTQDWLREQRRHARDQQATLHC